MLTYSAKDSSAPTTNSDLQRPRNFIFQYYSFGGLLNGVLCFCPGLLSFLSSFGTLGSTTTTSHGYWRTKSP